jgi:hypothetical protein
MWTREPEGQATAAPSSRSIASRAVVDSRPVALRTRGMKDAATTYELTTLFAPFVEAPSANAA